MSIRCPESNGTKKISAALRVYNFLTPRAYSVIVFGALFCTLAAKFFHSVRQDCVSEYFGWVLTDIAVLLSIELVLSLVCFVWPRRWAIRTALVAAAIVCTWSVMNGGWLIRTGTQILPTVLLPLFRDPLNSLVIVGVNLAKMPVAAVALLGPSAIALGFFFAVLARPVPPSYTRKGLDRKVLISCIIIFTVLSVRLISVERALAQITSQELRYNCHLRALTNLLLPSATRLSKEDMAEAKRLIPAYNDIIVEHTSTRERKDRNVVIVVLEGVQYKYTSLVDKERNLTPYLATIAADGVEFSNARTTLTHTTKVLFALLTGRYPSLSQDIAEAVPVQRPYASLATILKRQSGFRTAFFQSAKGNFESRPGLVHNLGFDKFWARDDLNKPNLFLGSLGSDEFAMLGPVSEWISEVQSPFFATILCSATHDPYEVPKWFAEPAKEPVDRYEQTIRYTDEFLKALDSELAKLGILQDTVLCVIGDHGEAFGEHGLLGHERIGFEEALRIPWVLRAAGLVEAGSSVSQAVSSIDLTVTLLSLLGFETDTGAFDGVDVLSSPVGGREVYFSGWLQESPVGFVRGNHKFIYYPTSDSVLVYDLAGDPLERRGLEVSEQEKEEISGRVLQWRKDSIFRIEQVREGEMVVFGRWLCRWHGRNSRKCTNLSGR